MTQYPENSALTLLTGATDPEGDTIRVRRIDGAIITAWPHVITLPSGTLSVTEFGAVTYDDGGDVSGHPADGIQQANGSFSYTLWDGVDESPVYQANIELSGVGSSAAVGDQTAEFGANTPAGQGGFRPIDTGGQAITLTSYQSLVSGSLNGYTPQISGGRLVFNQTGAPHGAVLRCAYSGGTIDLAISEVISARSAANLTEAKTAIQSYIATNPTAKYTVILRHGTFQVGNNFSNLQMNCSAITGVGGTRGAPRNPGIQGGSIMIRPGNLGSGNREKVLLTGEYAMKGSRGLHFKHINFAHRTNTIGYQWEPEHKTTISSAVAGNPTTITIAKGVYANTQIKPGDRMLTLNMSGGSWSNLNDVETVVLSATPLGNGGVTVTVDHNSNSYGNFSSGSIRGAIAKTENFRNIYGNSNAGIYPLAIFEECEIDNRAYEPNPGLWPNGFEPSEADEIAFVGCKANGFQHFSKDLSWSKKVYMVDNMVEGAYGDNFAVRTNRVIAGLLGQFPNVSITNVQKNNPARVTTAQPHGLRTGDTICIRNVNGATQANGNWFVNAVINNTTIELAQKNKNNRTAVSGTGWGNYQNGGTLYGPVASEIWIEGNYLEHANEPQWKAKHTDGIQGSSPNNILNCKWWIYDNVFNLWTDDGIEAQTLLGKGGAADPTFHEGPVRGNLFVGTAINLLFGGLSRTGETELRYNTVIREPAAFFNVPGKTRLFGEPNPSVGNIVGAWDGSGPTPTQESNFYVDQQDNNPSYDTVFAGTFVKGSDNVWRCPSLRGLTGDRQSRIDTVKALLTPTAPYKSFGATADPNGAYYTP